MQLIIKGAVYFDEKNDMIVVPHFTGEYHIVDCDTYEQIHVLEEKYDSKYIDRITSNDLFCGYKGNIYYSTQSSPCSVLDWELLSDLSELVYFEEDTEF